MDHPTPKWLNAPCPSAPDRLSGSHRIIEVRPTTHEETAAVPLRPSVLLAICVFFVVWQESFHLKQFRSVRPHANPGYSGPFRSSIFLLMVTLAWVLVRTGLKLYIERQANQAGSRIKT